MLRRSNESVLLYESTCFSAAMSFRNLDLNLLRVFDTVMDERNLTRSAQRLMMTQPAISNALRRMRESLGHDLFNRSPKGVKPTAYAEQLWPAVRVALAALRDVIDPVDFGPRTVFMSRWPTRPPRC
jgi:DNA-binding transcriptional LysR family regulator